MNKTSNGRGRRAPGGQDGKRPKSDVRNGDKLDGGKLDDVAGGTLPAVNDPYAENF